MRAAELGAVAGRLLRVPARARARMEAVLGELEDSVQPEWSDFNFFELGLSSAAPRRFQVNHIQGYKNGQRKIEQLLARRKAAGALSIVERLNAEGAAYGAERVEALLELLRRNRSVYERVLFSFEFDVERGDFHKITVYGFIRSKPQARALLRLLGLPAAPAPAVLRDLFNIGVDFRPDGTHQLKIYRRWPLALSLFEKGPAKSFLSSLSDLFPLRDYGTMERLDGRGRPCPPLKWGVNFCQNTKVGELRHAPALQERFSAFLDWAAGPCAQLDVSYLGFERDALGLYCGRTLERWLTSVNAQRRAAFEGRAAR